MALVITTSTIKTRFLSLDTVGSSASLLTLAGCNLRRVFYGDRRARAAAMAAQCFSVLTVLAGDAN